MYVCVHCEFVCVHAYRGEKFRTAFKSLGGLRALTTAPFVALTATAPPEVEAELLTSLELNDPAIVKHPLDRPNIYLSVVKVSLAVSFLAVQLFNEHKSLSSHSVIWVPLLQT